MFAIGEKSAKGKINYRLYSPEKRKPQNLITGRFLAKTRREGEINQSIYIPYVLICFLVSRLFFPCCYFHCEPDGILRFLSEDFTWRCASYLILASTFQSRPARPPATPRPRGCCSRQDQTSPGGSIWKEVEEETNRKKSASLPEIQIPQRPGTLEKKSIVPTVCMLCAPAPEFSGGSGLERPCSESEGEKFQKC